MPDDGGLNDVTKKSWGNLLGHSYNLLTDNGQQTDENSPFGSAAEALRRIRSLPISIVNSGTYHWFNADVTGFRTIAEIWSNRPSSSKLAYYLNSSSQINYLNTRYASEKVYGLLIRCVQRTE